MPPTVLPAAEGVTTRSPDTSRTKSEAPDTGTETRLYEIARDCTRLHEAPDKGTEPQVGATRGSRWSAQQEERGAPSEPAGLDPSGGVSVT